MWNAFFINFILNCSGHLRIPFVPQRDWSLVAHSLLLDFHWSWIFTNRLLLLLKLNSILIKDDHSVSDLGGFWGFSDASSFAWAHLAIGKNYHILILLILLLIIILSWVLDTSHVRVVPHMLAWTPLVIKMTHLLSLLGHLIGWWRTL